MSDRARERLSRFVEEGGIAVTTGQQAGLLTGPLFTIYKALTLVRLAEQLEAELGTLVIPIFWVASEDHDWEEINHAYLALPRDGVRRVDLTDEPPFPLPVGDVQLGSGIGTILDEVADLLTGNGYNESLLKSIRDAYRDDATLASSFTALLTELLAPFDLCLTDAADAAVKEGSAEVLATALRSSAEHERILRERTERLEAAGYHAQVAVLEEGTNVFHHGEQGRTRIYHDGSTFQTADGETLGSEAELLSQMEREPGRFSPNVQGTTVYVDSNGNPFVNGSFFDFVAEQYQGTTVMPLASPPDAWPGRALVEWSEKLMRQPGYDADIESIIPVSATLDQVLGR